MVVDSGWVGRQVEQTWRSLSVAGQRGKKFVILGTPFIVLSRNSQVGIHHKYKMCFLYVSVKCA